MKRVRPVARVQRCELAVPATSDRFVKTAAQSAADAIFLDLEDSVVPAAKVEARARAIAALNGIDWGTKLVSVRVNALDTPWGCRDVLDVAEACPRLDRILLPKCDSPAHIDAVTLMLSGAVAARGAAGRPLGISALIETARGLTNVEAIAATDGPLEALIFGAGDFQLDMHIFGRSVGAPSSSYAILTDAGGERSRQRHWNDPWHFAMARVATACRANGLAPIDGPFTNLADADGLASAAARAAALGFEGKWAIHPSQIDAVTATFTPSAEQLAWAREVVALLAEAGKSGRGAARDAQGNMIDMAHVRMAEQVLARAQRIDARERRS
jgi:malyl-CoA/(S)-citramalyl-CoA lyase